MLSAMAIRQWCSTGSPMRLALGDPALRERCVGRIEGRTMMPATLVRTRTGLACQRSEEEMTYTVA